MRGDLIRPKQAPVRQGTTVWRNLPKEMPVPRHRAVRSRHMRIGMRLWLALGLLGAPMIVPVSVHAATRKCTPRELKDGDKWLWLSPADKQLSIETQLPWGAPPEANETTNPLLVQRDYVIRYSTTLLVPLWSAEKLTWSKIGKVKGRVECFRADPRIPAPLASLPSDYKEPIYDQGHSVPDADQDRTVRSVVNTYVMSNMSPQTCQFNRGIWQILEQVTRRWAKAYKTVYVLNGAVFDRDGDGVRDPDDQAVRMKSNNLKTRVAVPSAFYRIIARPELDGRVATIAILLPHTTDNPTGPAALDYLAGHITTVAAIEQLTGYDFFPAAPTLDEATTLWPYNGYTPQSLCPATAPTPP